MLSDYTKVQTTDTFGLSIRVFSENTHRWKSCQAIFRVNLSAGTHACGKCALIVKARAPC